MTSSTQDRQLQVTSSQPIPTLRDSCSLYTILHRGQTASGNILTTHPSHRDSCGLYTILRRGQTVAGNTQTPRTATWHASHTVAVPSRKPAAVAEPSPADQRCTHILTIVTAVFSCLDIRQLQSPTAQDKRLPAEPLDGTSGRRRCTCRRTRHRHRRTSQRHTGRQPSGSGAKRTTADTTPTAATPAANPAVSRAATAAGATPPVGAATSKGGAGGPGTVFLQHHPFFCMPRLLSSPSCALAVANKLEGHMWAQPSPKESVGAPDQMTIGQHSTSQRSGTPLLSPLPPPPVYSVICV